VEKETKHTLLHFSDSPELLLQDKCILKHRKKKDKIINNQNNKRITKNALNCYLVVMLSEAASNNRHKGTPMLLATASVNVISTPSLIFKCRKKFNEH
jgi:3-methyladenine DNA glycosylase Tag